jgi:hypothetical protein
MAQTKEDLRLILRRQLADQLPHLFPPNPKPVFVSALESVAAAENASYHIRRYGRVPHRFSEPDELAGREDGV